jgi:hypothetical protein
VDGEGKNDWITCSEAQEDLIAMIDALIKIPGRSKMK